MADDLIREVRRGVLKHMKQDAALTALIPASRLYPSTTPAIPQWPFGRFDAPQSVPISLSCVEGATVTFLYHGFAKPRTQAARTVETAEDVASRIGAAMKLCLHNRRIPVGQVTARLRVLSSRLLRDPDEQDAYHSILSVEARVLAA